jgi:hypothetical protein
MAGYKYPFVPKEYYPAVMYDCQLIRKYGTFNRAIKAAADKYSVDESELEKHVRKRQGAGQKGKTRKYKWYVVTGELDEWVTYGDVNMLRSQCEHDFKPEKVVCIVKASNSRNIKDHLPKGTFDCYGDLCGYTMQDIDYTEFDTEKEAKAAMKKVKDYLERKYLK